MYIYIYIYVTRTKVVKHDYILWNVSTSYTLSLEFGTSHMAQKVAQQVQLWGHKGAGVFEIFRRGGLAIFSRGCKQ